MLPPPSATAIFIGCPISPAFFSAAAITLRASANVTIRTLLVILIGTALVCLEACWASAIIHHARPLHVHQTRVEIMGSTKGLDAIRQMFTRGPGVVLQ